MMTPQPMIWGNMTEQRLQQWLQNVAPHADNHFPLQQGLSLSCQTIREHRAIILWVEQSYFPIQWVQNVLRQVGNKLERDRYCKPLNPQNGHWRWWVEVQPEMNNNDQLRLVQQLIAITESAL